VFQTDIAQRGDEADIVELCGNSVTLWQILDRTRQNGLLRIAVARYGGVSSWLGNIEKPSPKKNHFKISLPLKIIFRHKKKFCHKKYFSAVEK
jgi:hypothetical protein